MRDEVIERNGHPVKLNGMAISETDDPPEEIVAFLKKRRDVQPPLNQRPLGQSIARFRGVLISLAESIKRPHLPALFGR